jgi:hypothetical protein
MDDGFKVVAKFPYQFSGTKYLMTASEVATMDYVRTQLSLPVPQVLRWSASAEDNPVGAEYILMEHVEGVPLEKCWSSLTWDERGSIIGTLAYYENRLFCIPFSYHGNLYYKASVPVGQKIRSLYDHYDDPVFCIGPSAEISLWKGEREHLEVDRGPCTTPAPGKFKLTRY